MEKYCAESKKGDLGMVLRDHADLFLSALQMDYSYSVLQLAIPLLAISLQASAADLGLLAALQRVLYIFICPVTGRLSDRWGRKFLALTGCSCLICCSLLFCTVGDLRAAFLLTPAVGLSVALFWPPIQAWLRYSHEAGSFGLSTGLFNVAWSVGALLGTLTAGFMMEIGSRAPFFVTAILGALILVLLAGSADEGGHKRSPIEANFYRPIDHPITEETMPARDLTQGRAALYSAWITLISLFLIYGQIITLFPKQATELGKSASAVGVLLAILGITRTFFFGIFGRLRRWLGTSDLLISVKVATLFCMLLLCISDSTVAFVLAFGAFGFAIAVAFSVSQYLSLVELDKVGRRIGIHESLALTGIVVGALMSGFLAQGHGLRAPYLVGMILALVLFLFQPSRIEDFLKKREC